MKKNVKSSCNYKKDMIVLYRYTGRCGGIGRRIRLKIVRETIWVRVPSAAA